MNRNYREWYIVFGTPNSVPYIERFNIQCPFIGGSFIRGSTVHSYIDCDTPTTAVDGSMDTHNIIL